MPGAAWCANSFISRSLGSATTRTMCVRNVACNWPIDKCPEIKGKTAIILGLRSLSHWEFQSWICLHRCCYQRVWLCAQADIYSQVPALMQFLNLSQPNQECELHQAVLFPLSHFQSDQSSISPWFSIISTSGDNSAQSSAAENSVSGSTIWY